MRSALPRFKNFIMENHQKIDRIVLTICAYVFGALVARQLAPEKAHTTLAGEPNHAAVAQTDEEAAIASQPDAASIAENDHQSALAAPAADVPQHNVELIAPANRVQTNPRVTTPPRVAARQAPIAGIVAARATAASPSSNVPESAATNESTTIKPDSPIEAVESAGGDESPQAVAIDGPLVEDPPVVVDDAAGATVDNEGVATENDAIAEDDAVAGNDAIAEDNAAVDDVEPEDVAAAADDIAVDPDAKDTSAAPEIVATEDQHGNNCPGAPLGAAEPAGVEPSDIFANEARGRGQSDADANSENVTGTHAPSAGDRATPELTPELIALDRKILHALDIYRQRNLNTAQHSAWSIMHSLISFGVEKELFIGGPDGQRVNAIGWICFNGRCRDENLFYLKDGRIEGRLGPGRQGHQGQFLAMLAQSRVKITYPMRIEGQDFTIADLVRAEQDTCRPKSELTFKLIGLSHYLDADETWESNDGQQWTIDRLVGEEIRQPIIGAACGGTHRLFGLAYAVDRRRRAGRPIDGNFLRAKIYLDDYHDYVFRLQNRDGSFSTNWFSGRGAEMDLNRRLETTGHTAEWLSFSLPDEELLRPQMVKAIDYLADLLIDGRNRDWKIGPQGHGLHALNIYHTRVFSSSAGRAIESLTDAK